jgi:GTP cyclohydrolase I
MGIYPDGEKEAMRAIIHLRSVDEELYSVCEFRLVPFHLRANVAFD